MKLTKHQNWPSRLGGYLLIPHEFLHLIGFRLVGKQCQYEWGRSYVTPIEPMTRRERIVSMLFPFSVFAFVFIICAILSGLAYGQAMRDASFFWFILWMGAALVMGFYAGTAITDLRQAYLLIFDKPWYGWTPFDIFFWPIVDWEEIREKVAAGLIDEKKS